MKPNLPALVEIGTDAGPRLCLWKSDRLLDLARAAHESLRTLDSLLELPLSEIRAALEDQTLDGLPVIEANEANWLAPCESQEVWAAGVTYRKSREARIEESTVADVYERVYEAARPELFFKANGWRVIGPGGNVAIRSDSQWNVPEPELALLCNAMGEIVAYACGNDMSSREIEAQNPLYLPQAKIYDGSCAIGPAAVLAWNVEHPMAIDLIIERLGVEVFSGATSTEQMVRDPEELARYLTAAYSLPHGAWLLTGTGIVPDEAFSVREGDEIRIGIGRLGSLVNRVQLLRHSGATAEPKLKRL